MGSRSRTRRRWAGLLLASLAGGWECADAQLVPDWGAECFDPLSPQDPSWLQNPVLRGEDIALPPARYVADPFLFRGDDRWWLFFELMLRDEYRAVIGVASSVDERHWHFDRVVLGAAEQLSYPLVFRWGEAYYLLPCINELDAVRLYRASPGNFPYVWTPQATLLSGRPFADATIFRHADRWWLLVSNGNSDTLWLYSSEELENPAAWQEHPASPIVSYDRSRARPAGRVLHLGGDRLVRLAQRSDQVYGEEVRAFEITALDLEHYAERELAESPVLSAGPDAWHRRRMHTLDAWWTGTRWLCAVDGYDGQAWSIGIYSDDPSPLGAPTAPGDAALGLDCLGWLRGAPLTLRCRVPEGEAATLALFDLGGRRLRRETLAGGASECEWEATDREGRPLPSGLYLISLRAAGQTVTRKAVLLK